MTTQLNWFKSSYSTADGPDCVEVAVAAGSIRIRDSKDPEGPQLAVGAASWAAFVTYAVRGSRG
ncbi:DUF397 domain-containing protein [Streptomyces sp. NPDC050315]|uniref:DUF397 domain-containing protein n=1 Tax=Streptomyces sp. NPDC050315 TaxID=3155039 RepID=UPI0034323E28